MHLKGNYQTNHSIQMKINFVSLLLILTFLFAIDILYAQDISETEFTSFNKEFLIVLENDNSKDTINLIDIIKGKNYQNHLIDINGDTINSQTFGDKVILLDFWFLTCKPCIVELPGLDLLAKKVKSDKFEVITFAIDGKEEIEDKLLSKHRFKFRIIPNVSQLEGSYPIKLLVNKNGEIIDYKSGGSVASNSINELLSRYLPIIKKEL